MPTSAMANIPDYHLARIENLSGLQMLHILQARQSVFVVEQKCAYQDADDCDRHAWHMMGHINGELACYVRIVDPGYKYSQPSIGRVLTTASFRGRQLGRAIMQEAIRQTVMLYPGQDIQIGAQAHLRAFYESLGFEQFSAEYMEDDIPHILMLWRTAADNNVNSVTL